MYYLLVEHLQYPIGRFDLKKAKLNDSLSDNIRIISQLPEKLQAVLRHLNPQNLSWSYRPKGWNISQLIHHLADSHLHAYLRCKFALYHNRIAIVPYDENKWADRVDNKESIFFSSTLLEGLHAKWSFLLSQIKDSEWKNCYFNPEDQQYHSLEKVSYYFSWHCQQHLEHIKQALRFKGKY